MPESIFLPPGTVACQNCDLLQLQPPDSSAPSLQDGEFTDQGWFCRACVDAGMKMTRIEWDAYWEWQAFEDDYPAFSAELKRLREEKVQR